MKGKLIKSKDLWYVEYAFYKTIGVVKGVMGSGHKIKDVQHLPLHPDDVKQIEEDSKIFDNIEARIAAYPEVEFEIKSYIPSFKSDIFVSETVSFTAVHYAKLIETKQD